MNNAWGMIKKNLLVHLTMMLLCAIVTFVGAAWLGALFGVVIYLTFLVLQYGDGCDRGERAATLSATMEKMDSDGHPADARTRAQAYSVNTALKAFLISSLPFALLAIVNLILADTSKLQESMLGLITRIVFLPMAGFIRLLTGMVETNYEGAESAAVALFGGITRAGVDMPGIMRNLSSIDSFAYTVKETLVYLTYMRVSFIFGAFLIPGAMFYGYTRGPKLREKKLKEIEIGSKRKKRKLKVGKQRKQRQIKPEV